jgi:hypothetical protein
MRESLLALLEELPQTHIELARILGKPRQQVRDELGALCGQGLVHRRGGTDKRWYFGALAVTPVRVARPAPELLPSWWVAASRDAFTQQCADQQIRMQQSKFGRLTKAGVIDA